LHKRIDPGSSNFVMNPTSGPSHTAWPARSGPQKKKILGLIFWHHWKKTFSNSCFSIIIFYPWRLYAVTGFDLTIAKDGAIASKNVFVETSSISQ
jgi:hypothetical protein